METSAWLEAAQKPKCPLHRSQRPRWNPRREARNCFRRKVRTADSANLHKHGSSHMQQQELGMAIHKTLPACDRVDHKGYLHLRGREREPGSTPAAFCESPELNLVIKIHTSYYQLYYPPRKNAVQHLQPNGQQAENDVRSIRTTHAREQGCRFMSSTENFLSQLHKALLCLA